MIKHDPSAVYGYIHDGMTRSFYIEGIEGLYPPVSGMFRPMQRKPRELIRRAAVRFITGEQDARLEMSYAETIRRHIVEWDFKKSANETVPLEVEPILKAQPELFEQFLNLVMGYSAPGAPPTDSPQVSQEPDDPALLLDSILGETTEEDTLRKN